MEKDILTELMQKCGSRVIVNGKEEIMPITDAKTMSSVIFESAEKDAEVRKLFSSVKKIDDEWRQRISDMWWGREEKDPIIDPRLYELREKLLTFGGDAVCMARGEPDIKEILKYGQLFESRLMDLSVNIPLEEALDLGWEILAECFEPNETGLRSELIAQRWPKKLEA